MVQNLLPTQTHFFKWRWLNEWLYRLREILTDNWTDSNISGRISAANQSMKVGPSFLFSLSLIWGKETHFQSPGNKCGMRRQLLPIPNKAPRSRELQIQERMRRTAAWSGDKVREGKTSRRSLPWPVVLSFTGLPRYLARMANSERWSKTRHGPGILSRSRLGKNESDEMNARNIEQEA